MRKKDVPVEVVERQMRALSLRRDGKSYTDIAKELGYTHPSGAKAAVFAALQVVPPEATAQMREIETARLDVLIEKLLPGIGPSLGGLQVVDRVLKIMERRAKLMGLDAPVKIAPTNPTGEAEYDPTGIIGRLLPELANRGAGEAAEAADQESAV